MRGIENHQEALFSYVSTETRIPKDHPLRAIRTMADEVLREMNQTFEEQYSFMGRPSIPPEYLIRATLLQILYTIRSERLLTGSAANEFFARVVELARKEDLLSDEHFSVDGTLIESWASLKSFRKKDESDAPLATKGSGRETKNPFGGQGIRPC